MTNKKNYPKILLDNDVIPYTYIQSGDSGIEFGCELIQTNAYIKVGSVLRYSRRGYKSKFFKVTNINTQPDEDKKYMEKFKYAVISGEWV